MSIYYRGEPVANQQFRDNTAKRSGKTLGVTSTPKRGKMRTEATGDHAKAGFVCHRCGND